MNRSFYSSAIYIAGLSILSGLLWSVIYFWLGTQVGELQSIGGWLLSGAMISLIWSLVLLKYYHYKQYWFTFWAMLILIGASLLQYILLFNVVSSREMTEGYGFATKKWTYNVKKMGNSIVKRSMKNPLD